MQTLFAPINKNRTPAVRSRRQLAMLAVASAYLILWTAGVADHWIGTARTTNHGWFASLSLLLAGLIVIIGADYSSDLAKLIAIASLGFGLEVLGVRLAIPFGAYAYTEVLRPQLFKVPLVIACAWMVLVAYVKQMLLYFNLGFWVELTIAAGWMTAIDLLIDPLAVNKLGYWQWVGPGSYYGVPANNFAGWFLASLVIFGIFRRGWKPNSYARVIGASVPVFFTLVALAHGLFVVAFIGFGLCLFHLAVSRLHKRTVNESSPLVSVRGGLADEQSRDIGFASVR
ncbi:MAG TPA: carotenoid biosynthesis protein [Pyrinomonadaceae bacterium]